MGIVELLTKIGDDRIAFQNLDKCFITADWNHKTGAKITFGTEEPVEPNGTERIGLVVWLDREQVREIISGAAPAAEQEGE